MRRRLVLPGYFLSNCIGWLLSRTEDMQSRSWRTGKLDREPAGCSAATLYCFECGGVRAGQDRGTSCLGARLSQTVEMQAADSTERVKTRDWMGTSK